MLEQVTKVYISVTKNWHCEDNCELRVRYFRVNFDACPMLRSSSEAFEQPTGLAIRGPENNFAITAGGGIDFNSRLAQEENK